MNKLILFLTALLCLAGCSSNPNKDLKISKASLFELSVPLRKNIVECMEKFSNPNTICPKPKPAIHKIDVNFTYGRFCGAGHPNLIEMLNFNENKPLSIEEKDVLLGYYDSIKPYDELDELCQMHDICWVKYGEIIECNDLFKKELKVLRTQLESEIGTFDVDTPQFRCGALITDISYSTLFFKGKGGEDVTTIVRIITTPVHVVYAFLFLSMGDVYPHEGEECTIGKNLITKIESDVIELFKLEEN